MVKKTGKMGGQRMQVSVQKEQRVALIEGQVFRLKLDLQLCLYLDPDTPLKQECMKLSARQ